MRFAQSTHIGALNIGEAAGAFTPDPIENFIQRAHLAGLYPLTRAKGLGRGGRGQSSTQQESNQ
jgi:hypothetical protein